MDKNFLHDIICNRFIINNLVSYPKKALIIFFEEIFYVDQIAQCYGYTER